jgi:hypothetical protein
VEPRVPAAQTCWRYPRAGLDWPRTGPNYTYCMSRRNFLGGKHLRVR